MLWISSRKLAPGSFREETMNSENRITPELAEAFADAIGQFSIWTPDTDELLVSIEGKPYTMTGVCGLVQQFRDDKVPANVLHALFGHMHLGHKDLQEQLTNDPSYATAAVCLMKMITYKKSDHEAKARSRREMGME
jgi:hypothetical protein